MKESQNGVTGWALSNNNKKVPHQLVFPRSLQDLLEQNSARPTADVVWQWHPTVKSKMLISVNEALREYKTRAR